MKLLLAANILMAIFQLADSHALLAEPKSRNRVACETCLGGGLSAPCPANPGSCAASGPDWEPGCREYNPYSAQAGGPGNTHKRGGGVWPTPVGSHGMCGDPVQGTEKDHTTWQKEAYLVPTPPQATYTAGQTVRFKVGISTEHYGFYVFRICDKVIDRKTMKDEQEVEDCLNQYILKRAPASSSDCQPPDEKHPERWYVTSCNGVQDFNKTEVPDAGPDWDDKDYVTPQGQCGGGAGHTTDKFVIPEDLHCEHCTLQWWWVSGNRCAYDADFGDYFKRTGTNAGGNKVGAPVCGGPTGDQFGEEFWNCADIKVNKNPNAPRRRRAPGPPTPGPPSRRRKSVSRRRRKSSSSRRRRSRRRRRSQRRRRRRKSSRRRR